MTFPVLPPVVVVSPPPAPSRFDTPREFRPTPFNRLAIVSMLLWVVPFLGSIGSVVTGHIALSQIRRSAERGRALAIAGAVLGFVSVASTRLVVDEC